MGEMITPGQARHAENVWAAGTDTDLMIMEHNSGAHDGNPSQFCAHRTCRKAK